MTKPFAAAALALLILTLAAPTHAVTPYVTSEYYYDEIDFSTRFEYRIQNLDAAPLTSFHVYAPINPALLAPVKGSFNGVDWTAIAFEDSPGVAQIRWQPATMSGWLGNGDSVKVMMFVSEPITVRTDFVRPPAYATNWGYGTVVAYHTGEQALLAVPQLVPEPSALLALVAGSVGLIWWRGR